MQTDATSRYIYQNKVRIKQTTIQGWMILITIYEKQRVGHLH